MPRSRRCFRALWRAAFVVAGAGTACAGHAGLPPVRRASLVPIESRTTPARAVVLSPIPDGSAGRPVVARAEALSADGRIVIRGRLDGPPPGAVAPAFVVDGRLWCPRRGPTGRFTEVAASVQALGAAVITTLDVVRGPAPVPYARRCGGAAVRRCGGAAVRRARRCGRAGSYASPGTPIGRALDGRQRDPPPNVRWSCRSDRHELARLARPPHHQDRGGFLRGAPQLDFGRSTATGPLERPLRFAA